jgi:hypothetical protein
MSRAKDQLFVIGRGIHVLGTTAAEVNEAARAFLDRLCELGVDQHVELAMGTFSNSPMVEIRLKKCSAEELTPDCDTTQICRKLNLDTERDRCDLEREILLAMLNAPIPFEFPSFAELVSSVRMRKNIVAAARKTALAFATSEAERPSEYWIYDEDRGFVVRPGKPLEDALQKATQPDQCGTVYSFSCYRATEYVIELAIAQEAAVCNPELHGKLQRQAETRAIKSGEFHRVFCREYGSRTEPLPLRYFVPGDRTWFRNPDIHSSDASGYEGSWVFYLGNCLFTNFWKRGKTFSLTMKCLEMFHWRDGTFLDDNGDLRMNESIVEARVQDTLKDPKKVEQILEKMERLYDPAGVYADGGCIDISREYPRWVRPESTDIVLPDAA